MKTKKKSWLCKLGFHIFETKVNVNGYVDIGESILRHEEIRVECIRYGCNKIKSKGNGKWVEFRKEE